jgi:hypothetical protein
MYILNQSYVLPDTTKTLRNFINNFFASANSLNPEVEVHLEYFPLSCARDFCRCTLVQQQAKFAFLCIVMSLKATESVDRLTVDR